MSNGECGDCGGCDCGSAKETREADLFVFGLLVRGAWNRETAEPDVRDRWTAERSVLGQAAVTTLLVQDRFGGEIMRIEIPDFGTHYYNFLWEGWGVDFTFDQLPPGTPVPRGEIVSREDLLNSAEAARTNLRERYELLKKAVELVGGPVLPLPES